MNTTHCDKCGRTWLASLDHCPVCDSKAAQRPGEQREPAPSPSLPPGSPSGVVEAIIEFEAAVRADAEAGYSFSLHSDEYKAAEARLENARKTLAASLPQSPATPAAAPVEGERVTPWAFPKKDCDLCRGSGFYGDNGPGRRGNGEYVRCECTASPAPGSQVVEETKERITYKPGLGLVGE